MEPAARNVTEHSKAQKLTRECKVDRVKYGEDGKTNEQGYLAKNESEECATASRRHVHYEDTNLRPSVFGSGLLSQQQ